MRATPYFCCSPGVSMFAKNNGIEATQGKPRTNHHTQDSEEKGNG